MTGNPIAAPIDWNNLGGRTALVTGASSGIGAAFAEEFAARGAHVVLVARNQQRLEAVADRIRSRASGVALTSIVLDLAIHAAAQELVAQLEQAGVTIDVLVNNAGVTSLGPVAAQPFKQQHDMLAVNTVAVSDLTNLLVPGMVRRGVGAVVTVASGGSLRPTANMAVYAASKAFVLSLSEALWAELRQSAPGLRVLAVVPGPTRTPALVDAAPTKAAAPEDVVRGAMRALPTNAPTVITDAGTRLQARLFRFMSRRRMTLLVAARTQRAVQK